MDYECIVDPVLDDYYMGDAMKLQQVLIDILSNAIKFTKEGGKVTLSAALRRKTKNDAVLRFIVNDTGIRIGEEFIPISLNRFPRNPQAPRRRMALGPGPGHIQEHRGYDGRQD